MMREQLITLIVFRNEHDAMQLARHKGFHVMGVMPHSRHDECVLLVYGDIYRASAWLEEPYSALGAYFPGDLLEAGNA